MSAEECLRLSAPAKINLFLRITGRRPDGYHTLVTLMQKLALYDELCLERIGQGIVLHCPDGKSPENRNNLVYRAAELFFSQLNIRGITPPCGVRITLHKHIPVAAGLGGGSSDAAATLYGLNQLTKAGLAAAELAALGLQLGADVPFFVHHDSAALAQGIGEELSPAEALQGNIVLLVNPGFAVSTRWVYQNLNLTSIDLEDNLQSSRDRCNDADFVNDLERVTLAQYPVIEELKKEVLQQGAAVALMSGSGPTVFGLFTDQARASKALRYFQPRFKDSYLVEPLQG
ncbi:MAG: 4-(cytidine 5'-diphospho)-2-C-methyl-D-erythritol kinase [bacterium]|nr:4-(cytidine 5'-diphospho)-2-C-methyl-D-erythritol kinase [bacterium]